METTRIITAENEDALWQQLTADLNRPEEQLEYSALLHQGPYQTQLDIDVDLGGGFEGGYASTQLAVRISNRLLLRFALFEQTWLQEIGKLLGQEDAVLGYPELDAAFIISTNDEPTLRELFGDAAIREALLRYPTLRLTLEPQSLAPDANLLLTFLYEDEALDLAQLRDVYHLLLTLAQRLSALPFGTPSLA